MQMRHLLSYQLYLPLLVDDDHVLEAEELPLLPLPDVGVVVVLSSASGVKMKAFEMALF
jgi:hypothetical protein